MKKNVKILGAAAAALLAVAPVVASATTVNADFTINPGANDNAEPNQTPLNINVTLNATADKTSDVDAAKSVKLSSSIGTINRTTGSVISIVNADGSDVKTPTLQPGVPYRVQVTEMAINGLTNNVIYNLGKDTKFSGADSNTPNAATGSQLVTAGTFTSATFTLAKNGDATQPYFSNASNGVQLANGATANVNNGAGVLAKDVTGGYTKDNIFASAKNAVTYSPAEAVYVTDADDVAKQLKDQGLTKNANGEYNVPANGFHVTLVVKSLMSNKTASVVVPFAGSEADYSHFPFVTFDSNEVSKDGYSDNFKGVWAQGTQSKDASQLIRIIPLGSTFDSSDAVKGFKANVSGTKPSDSTAAEGTGSTIDMAVLSNPVNTQVPGQYTVTLQATNWANGKTTRFQYIVQVGENGATYQTVNYPAAYGVNVWNIAGNTASFTGRRVQGGSRVATFGTKTVNGVSYTEINKKGSNEWIQTQYLGNHSNENKPSNNGETKLNGTGRVNYNGKGAVRLLNANGHYVDQYVKKGSSFKVWAEKTVNGQHLYRIGSQSQWIPAKYFSLN